MKWMNLFKVLSLLAGLGVITGCQVKGIHVYRNDTFTMTAVPDTGDRPAKHARETNHQCLIWEDLQLDEF